LASAKEPTDGHHDAANGAARNLPAKIDGAPTPPVTADRLGAVPEDDTERFAFALWHAGRKDEAVEFLERQFARRGGDEALRAAAMTLDIAPTPVTFVPRKRPRRSAIALAGGAVLAIAVAVVWTGVAALPKWIGSEPTLADATSPDTLAPLATDSGSDKLALAADERDVEDVTAEAPVTTGAVVLTANDVPPPEDAPALPLAETADAAALTSAAEAPASEETVIAAAGPADSDATPAADVPPATGLARLAAASHSVAPAPVPAAQDVADTGPLPDAAQPTQLAETDAPPEALDDVSNAPATLAALTDEVLSETRLPRPRPTPSPETIAAVTRPSAPARDPYYVVPEPQPYADAALPAPPTYGDPNYVPLAPPAAYENVADSNGLTIIGRVNEPAVIYKRAPNGRIYRFAPPPAWGAPQQPYAPPPGY
jgi:hypothetical protein